MADAAGRIKWDATGERLYELGVDHGVLYLQKNDGSYDVGVAWNGLTGVTESPDGAEPNDMYADNIKYASLRSAETFGFTIEAYQSPVEFDQCDGSAVAAQGVFVGQQDRKHFGFVYRTKIGNDVSGQDKGYKLHIVYGASASPSEKSYETVNDSPEGITLSWECTTDPVTVSGFNHPVSTIVINSLKADPTKLATLEDTLFGKDATVDPVAAATDPTLPDPATLLAIFTAT